MMSETLITVPPPGHAQIATANSVSAYRVEFQSLSIFIKNALHVVRVTEGDREIARFILDPIAAAHLAQLLASVSVGGAP